jgi:hypothetical protein
MRAGAACTTRSTAPTRSRTTGGAKAARAINKARGAKVIAKARAFLDAAVPLATGSHADVVAYSVIDGQLAVNAGGGATAAGRKSPRNSPAIRAMRPAPRDPAGSTTACISRS